MEQVLQIEKGSLTPVEFSRAISRHVADRNVGAAKMEYKQVEMPEKLGEFASLIENKIQSGSRTPIEFSRSISRFIAARKARGAKTAYERMNGHEQVSDVTYQNENQVDGTTQCASSGVTKLPRGDKRAEVPGSAETALPPLSPTGEDNVRMRVAKNRRRIFENSAKRAETLRKSNLEGSCGDTLASAITETTGGLTQSSSSWGSPSSARSPIRVVAEDRDHFPVPFESLSWISKSNQDDFNVATEYHKDPVSDGISEHFAASPDQDQEDLILPSEPSFMQADGAEKENRKEPETTSIESAHFLQLRILSKDEECTACDPPGSRIEVYRASSQQMINYPQQTSDCATTLRRAENVATSKNVKCDVLPISPKRAPCEASTTSIPENGVRTPPADDVQSSENASAKENLGDHLFEFTQQSIPQAPNVATEFLSESAALNEKTELPSESEADHSCTGKEQSGIQDELSNVLVLVPSAGYTYGLDFETNHEHDSEDPLSCAHIVSDDTGRESSAITKFETIQNLICWDSKGQPSSSNFDTEPRVTPELLHAPKREAPVAPHEGMSGALVPASIEQNARVSQFAMDRSYALRLPLSAQADLKPPQSTDANIENYSMRSIVEDREQSSPFESPTEEDFREYSSTPKSNPLPQDMVFLSNFGSCPSSLPHELAIAAVSHCDNVSEDETLHRSGSLPRYPTSEHDQRAAPASDLVVQTHQTGGKQGCYHRITDDENIRLIWEQPEVACLAAKKPPEHGGPAVLQTNEPTEMVAPIDLWESFGTHFVTEKMVNKQHSSRLDLETVEGNPTKVPSRFRFVVPTNRSNSSRRKARKEKANCKTPKRSNRSKKKVHRASPKSRTKVLRAKIDAFFDTTIPLIQERKRMKSVEISPTSSSTGTERERPPKEIRLRRNREARLHELYWNEARERRQHRLLLVSAYRSRRHGRNQVNKLLWKAQYNAERRMKTRERSHPKRRDQLVSMKSVVNATLQSGTPPRHRLSPSIHQSRQYARSEQATRRRSRSSSRSRPEKQPVQKIKPIKADKHDEARRESSSRSRKHESHEVWPDHGKESNPAEPTRNSCRYHEKKNASKSRVKDCTDRRKRPSHRPSAEKKKSPPKGTKSKGTYSSCTPRESSTPQPRRRSSSRNLVSEDDSTKPTNKVAGNHTKLKSPVGSSRTHHVLLSMQSDEDSDATPPPPFGIVRTVSFFEGSE